MMTIPSWMMLIAAGLIVFVAGQPRASLRQEREGRMQGWICVLALILGCVLRLASLSSLLPGLSAEEALVGVQAKALWQTGGFYPDGMLTTLLPQWSGAHTGPLLCALTAPFVGLMGISALSVRLPLALLSIAAIPAAYVLGCELSGRKAGRFLWVIYALAPYFVLGARMTCGANAVLYMLPIAAALLAVGLRKPAFLYPGMIVLALSAYTQQMMLLISPLTVVGVAAIALLHGKNRLHALLSAVLGFALSMPALLTACVNIAGTDGFALMNFVQIPGYDLFVNHLLTNLPTENGLAHVVHALLAKTWCAVIGGIFQAVWTENIHSSLFMPDGMLALTVVSVPLMLLAAGTLAMQCIDGKKCAQEHRASRRMLVMMFVVALACMAVLGGEGSYDVGGAPDVFDHMPLFFFAAVLMAAGWRQIQQRSCVAQNLLAVLLAVCFAGVGVHLFGGDYRMNANIYFDGFADACVRAREIQNERGGKIHVTTAVYPHVAPYDASEMMYMFAVDADMREEQDMEPFYASSVEYADETQIYVVESSEISGWDWGEMNYEEFGNYAVIAG